MKSVKIRKQTTGLSGSLSFPGDKSLSHRAVIFGALAEGTSCFTNVLAGEDCVCTREAFREMGVKIESSADGTELTIHGVGLKGLKAPKKELYLGNSGTSMRLLMGVLAGQSFSATLTGDPSLSSRPMKRVSEPLRQMDAKIEGKDNGNYAPITIHGTKLRGIDYIMPMASAQVKSAILLAGLYADGLTRVTEPEKSRDHTESFLKYYGANINEDGLSVSVLPGKMLKAKKDDMITIPGDISSASFFMAAALLVSGSSVDFKSILNNPTRAGINNVLKRMGVSLFSKSSTPYAFVGSPGPEPTADFTLAPLPNSKLKPFIIERRELPSLIDEIPILCVLATQAEGESVIRDADELRIKESDRIESIIGLLKPMGANIWAEGNTIHIKGPTKLKGAVVNSKKDHRIAMSGVVAGLLAEGETTVQDIECIDTSFPTFFKLLKKLDTHFSIG